MTKNGNYHSKNQLLKYVPKGKLEAIQDAVEDNDGMWIWLNVGWEASRMDIGARVIHEDTIAQLRYQIAGIRRV